MNKSQRIPKSLLKNIIFSDSIISHWVKCQNLLYQLFAGKPGCSYFLPFYKEKLRDFFLHRTLCVLNYSIGSTPQSKAPGLKGVHIIKATSKSAHFTTSLPEGNVIIFANVMVFHLHVAISKIWASLVAQLVKNPSATWETCVWSLGWEDPPGEGKSYPLQHPGLENSKDCIVHGVTTERLSNVLPGAIFCGLCY